MDLHDLSPWLDQFRAGLLQAFGPELVFLGIQGSYARGEATHRSDIDVVVILEQLTKEAAGRYRALLDTLPRREQVCGFVSSRAVLSGWDGGDRFQFYYDTVPLLGRLEDLFPVPGREEARRALHTGACGLYHACCHNLLHARDPKVLTGLCKTAAFSLQALHFLRTGTYVRRRADLLPLLPPEDRAILEGRALAEGLSTGAEADFDALSQRLLDWAAGHIAAGA